MRMQQRIANRNIFSNLHPDHERYLHDRIAAMTEKIKELEKQVERLVIELSRR